MKKRDMNHRSAEDRTTQVRVKELLNHEDTVEGSKLMFGFLKATGLIQRLEQNKDCSGRVKPEGGANAAKTNTLPPINVIGFFHFL